MVGVRFLSVSVNRIFVLSRNSLIRLISNVSYTYSIQCAFLCVKKKRRIKESKETVQMRGVLKRAVKLRPFVVTKHCVCPVTRLFNIIGLRGPA